ncbi:MAG: alkaline phosphatase family protein [Thermodesulfovibrionales bacterium]|jgi:phospholipase C
MANAVSLPAVPASFQKIKHVVVLLLENRSFDHLVGFMRTNNPNIVGLAGNEMNYGDPNNSQSPETVGKATSFTMPFDPAHEFMDVQLQLYGPKSLPTSELSRTPNSPTDPAPMNGFLCSAIHTAQQEKDAFRIMECFQPGQATVLSALIQEFALFNFWHSSLPGPTWPNRFFVHAATSGGLTDSPDDEKIIAGFSFPNGTLYERLADVRKEWRIYHDGLPQSAGIDSLRLDFIDPLTKNFREMDNFTDDVNSGGLPEYTFIEPNYNSGSNYVNGNSMHPLNDIRKGELLVKQVYETLRNSALWDKVVLVVTFDEHGGFYDHVSPPSAVPTGDDTRYANPQHPFTFDRLGVRVPAVVVSAYTQKGAVIGTDAKNAATRFDHTSILATASKLFGLRSLTKRDENANTFDIALNLDTPRLTPADALTALPDPAPDSVMEQPVTAPVELPLSRNQQNELALAHACNVQISDPALQQALKARFENITRQKDAADYIHEVEDKIHARRVQRKK